MEEFTVRNMGLDDNLELYKILWKAHSRKGQKSVSVLLCVSLAFLLIGIFTHNEYNMVSDGNTRIYYNLNLFLSLGIAGTILFSYWFNVFRKARKNYLKTAAGFIEQFDGVTEFRLKLSEEFIAFDETLICYKIDWRLLRNKFYSERFIFLNRSDSSLDGISIDARSLTDEEFDRLTAFIDRKISSTRKTI